MGIETNGTRYFDRYLLLEPREQTASGTLWDARDELTGEELAIEVVAPNYAWRADVWARMQRAHALSAKLAHSNVLAVLEPRRADEITIQPMQFAANGDVRSLATAPYHEILPILIDVAAAMRHAHSLRIAHLALSSRNIRLDAGNCALVTGFEFDGGTAEEFDAAMRKDLRDFAMLASELLDGPQRSPGRAAPPRLRALFDEVYDSSFTPTPLSFAAIVEELELAQQDTAPLELERFDFSQVATSQRLRAERMACEAAGQLPLPIATGPAGAADVLLEQAEPSATALDWSKLGLEPAPLVDALAAPADGTAPPTPRESLYDTSEIERGDAQTESRRFRRVRRQALAWRWLAGSVAIAMLGAAYYLGVRNEQWIAGHSPQAPTQTPRVAAAKPVIEAPTSTRTRETNVDVVAAAAPPARPLRRAAPVAESAPRRVDTLLADGEAALNDFDVDRARRAFAAALSTQPRHGAAQRGLRRVRVLNGMRALVEDARRAEVARNYPRAAQGYSHASTLDREHRVPRLGLARVRQAVAAQPIQRRVIEAYVSLGAGRLEQAQQEFAALAQGHGDDAQIRDGLALASAALTARQLAPRMRQAATLERAQEWTAALQIYDAVLATHPDYLPARFGRQRVATLAAPMSTTVSSGASAPQNGY